MCMTAFIQHPIPCDARSHHPPRRRWKTRPCLCSSTSSYRIGITETRFSGNSATRSARIAILTDFSSNPVLAIRDRAFDPLSAFMLAFAALCGGLFAKFAVPRPDDDFSAEIAASRDASESDSDTLVPEQISTGVYRLPSAARSSAGENAIWLNMSLRTIWRLFRKSTNTLTKEVLQPVLDNMEFPHPIRSMQITSLSLGESPALVRKIERLPSRSLSEIQYRFGARLVGDKEGRIYMDVTIQLPGLQRIVVVPICISSLDIDAKVWVGFSVVPYKPWVRFAQWALVKMPSVKTKIQIANLLPITTIPFLSSIIDKIISRDIPREFLFPKTQIVDLMDEDETDVSLEQDMLEARGVSTSMQHLSEEKLRSEFPRLSSLFDAIDIDQDGSLSEEEVSLGLVEWGYASDADRNSIGTLLDVDNDGKVQLREFISVWGDLQNVFVPSRFRGVLSGVLLKAEDLRTPLIGMSDPYVVLSIEAQSTTSKRNLATSRTGKGRGKAVWNEGWELFVERPKTAVLRVIVREGCYFSYYRERISPPPPSKAHSGTSDTPEVTPLTPGRTSTIERNTNKTPNGASGSQSIASGLHDGSATPDSGKPSTDGKTSPTRNSTSMIHSGISTNDNQTLTDSGVSFRPMREGAIIGYGSVPISDLKGSASSIWVELMSGGGRVRLDVQFSEFVDPKVI